VKPKSILLIAAKAGGVICFALQIPTEDNARSLCDGQRGISIFYDEGLELGEDGR